MLKRQFPARLQKPKVFIAAPYRNQPQSDLVLKIENILTQNGYNYVSPRDIKVNTYEQAKEAIRFRNIERDACNLLLAVMDQNMAGGLDNPEVKPFVLHTTDAEIAFEIGITYETGKHIVLFTFDVQSPMPFLLTQPADGIITGLENLEKFFSPDGINESVVDYEWVGGYL